MRTKAFVSCLAATALVLAGCATDQGAQDKLEELVGVEQDAAPEQDFELDAAMAPGPPLPSGAVYEHAGTKEAAHIETEAIRGSLRPDDRTPEERVPRIIERGRIIVGVDQSNNLLSYRDTVTGELQGFEVDLAREIAEDIFGDPNRVDFRYIDSEDRNSALDSGFVDVVIRSMTINAARQKEVEFSIPYLTTQTRMLVMNSSGIESIEQLPGRTVCVASSTTSADKTRKAAPKANLLITRSWGDCLMAIQLGQADAVITDDTLLSGMVDQDPYTTIVGEDLATEAYGVGIRKADSSFDSRGLTRQVNSTLERIRQDGTWQRMYQQWFSEYLPTPQLPAPNYRTERRPATSREES